MQKISYYKEKGFWGKPNFLDDGVNNVYSTDGR